MTLQIACSHQPNENMYQPISASTFLTDHCCLSRHIFRGYLMRHQKENRRENSNGCLFIYLLFSICTGGKSAGKITIKSNSLGTHWYFIWSSCNWQQLTHILLLQSKNENFEHLIMNFDVFSPLPYGEKLKPEIEKNYMLGSQFVWLLWSEPDKLKLTHITFI